MVKMVLYDCLWAYAAIYTTWEIMDERPTVFPQMSRA